jgi:hypothetical protein
MKSLAAMIHLRNTLNTISDTCELKEKVRNDDHLKTRATK